MLCDLCDKRPMPPWWNDSLDFLLKVVIIHKHDIVIFTVNGVGNLGANARRFAHEFYPTVAGLGDAVSHAHSVPAGEGGMATCACQLCC